MATAPLFRFCNAVGVHFYTTNADEVLTLRDRYSLEPEGFEGHLQKDQLTGTIPFFRLRGPNGHLYTSSQGEVEAVTAGGWVLEGTCGYIAPAASSETTPLYRLCHPGTIDHFYTTNAGEYNAVRSGGWRDEGIAGYVWKGTSSGTMREQFYAKEDSQQWWAGVKYENGSWGIAGGIPTEWRRRTYRIGGAGYRIVSFQARETAKNNDASWTVQDHNGAKYVTLGVEQRALFGASNWVGVEVRYELERGW